MQTAQVLSCPLCKGSLRLFADFKGRTFLQCENCHSLVLHPDSWLDPAEEKSRYELHENDVHDPHYRKFVQPIVEAVYTHHTPADTGLDYGAGPGPVIAAILREKGYPINTYDPFYHPHSELLTQKYDYLICCEVMEHFHEPYLEFTRMRNLLNPGGSIYCMTSIYHEAIDFKGWGYKNDDTHVFFYHARAIEWIRAEFRFSSVTINNRFIQFKVDGEV